MIKLLFAAWVIEKILFCMTYVAMCQGHNVNSAQKGKKEYWFVAPMLGWWHCICRLYCHCFRNPCCLHLQGEVTTQWSMPLLMMQVH